MGESGHRSLMRADRILDHVARAQQAPTLSSIARHIGAPVSSTHDLVRELCVLGYLRVVSDGYAIGLRPHLLSVVAGLPHTMGLDHGELVRLSAVAGAPIATAGLVGHEIYYLDHAGPRAPQHLQVVADDHRPRPVLRTATGRLLLALCDEPIRDRILADIGPRDPEAVAVFTAELATIRRHRLARSDGLADPDIAAIAIPSGHPDIAVMLTSRRAPRGGRVPALEAAARRLQVALGAGAL